MFTLAEHTITEKIYESSRTLIFRGLHPQTAQSVVLKCLRHDHPDQQLLDRFSREYSLTALYDSAHIVHTYGLHNDNNKMVMVLEDCGLITLASLLTTVKKSLQWSLAIAIQLTQTLIEVHKKNVIYGDLNPTNILYNHESQTIKLIDFGSAVKEADTYPLSQGSLFAGPLPYIAPEQTGRLAKRVDYRADIYSLGIVLYELFTGSLPFVSKDPVEMIHLHLAKQVPPPAAKDPSIPRTLSNMLIKLLEKDRSNRYQTCTGLLLDLQRCLRDLQSSNTIHDFVPGQDDQPTALVFPAELYRRQTALDQLLTAFAEMEAGKPSVATVGGYAGIGKTSLIRAFKEHLPPSSGLFLTGKFDLANPDRPYEAFTQIIDRLVQQLLSESDSRISAWRASLSTFLYQNGQVLFDLFPDIELLTGSLPAAPLLPPFETEVRLFRCCMDFIYSFSTAEIPLIIFQDDIHRASPSSLKLVEKMICDSRTPHIFFIFCYRSNEVDSTHPLLETLKLFEQQLDNYLGLSLQPLERDDIISMLSRTLSHPKDKVKQLAEICLQKTGGNPFFIKQFLLSVNHAQHLVFQRSQGGWKWNIQAIQQEKLTDNIADLLELVTEGLLTADVDGAYPAKEAVYHFSHDLIQHAAYSQLSPQEQAKNHLLIGRFLFETHKPNSSEFTIITHLNRGIEFLDSADEKQQLLRANLNAGKKATASAAYELAHKLLQTALRLLPSNGWKTDYSLALELHTAATKAALLNKEYRETARLFETVCLHATSTLDTAEAYHLHIQAQKADGQIQNAFESCLEILGSLGVRFPQAPSRLQMLLTVLRTKSLLARRTTADILELAEMTDPHKLEIMRFLVDIGTTVYYIRPDLLPFIAHTAIQLSLGYGNSHMSGTMGYSVLGLLLCAIPGGSLQRGYELGQLALTLQQRMGDHGINPATLYLVNNLIIHWQEHIQQTLQPLLQAHQSSMERGDFEIAANAAYGYSYRLYFIGHNLEKTARDFSIYTEIITATDQQVALCRHQLFHQAVDNLLGNNDDPTMLCGRYYDETKIVPILEKSGNKTSLFQYHLIKAIHFYLFGDPAKARNHSRMAGKLLQSVLASIFVPVFYFYDSLIELALYDTQPRTKRLLVLFAVSANQRKLHKYSRHSPGNYHHKHTLVEAEKARVQQQFMKAMDLYDKAIQRAGVHNYHQEEALAYELAGRFYESQQKNRIAQPYMKEARYGYYRWGAFAKIDQLDSLAAGPANSSMAENTQGVSHSNNLSPPLTRSELDLMTVIRTSRILTDETDHHELLKKVIDTLLETSGGQRGFLVCKEGEEWRLKVYRSLDEKTSEVLQGVKLENQHLVPSTVINYVIRTGKEIVIDDATREAFHIGEDYLFSVKPLSILCTPMIYQDEILCILYLENNLTTSAFSQHRQEILNHLSNQAAITLKNSRLFNELEHTVSDLNKEVRHRKDIQRQLLHSEKLSALGRLSSSIAHEFGNPLMGIKYLFDDLEQRLVLSDDDRQLFNMGREECLRMRQLLKGLQQLHQPSSGKKSRTDLHAVIDGILQLQKNFLTSHQIVAVTDFMSAIPYVMTVRDQLCQVLVNLITNSVDAMPDGGTITITTTTTAGRVELTVHDTGQGISPDVRERIFEPFYSTKDIDGSGLGLSTSYSIIKSHGGDLSFTSHPATGTSFTISLPHSG